MGGVIWGVPTFVRQLVVQAPVEQVFAFHEREDTLPGLSPPFPPMRVVRRTGGIRTGARVWSCGSARLDGWRSTPTTV